MNKLKASVEQMEATRQQSADPLRELRHWRLKAEQRFMSVVVKAAKVDLKKGRK